MKVPVVSRSHFIYEVDNIPDHRSRRFGCSASQMAIRDLWTTKRKAISRRPPGYGQRKMDPL